MNMQVAVDAQLAASSWEAAVHKGACTKSLYMQQQYQGHKQAAAQCMWVYVETSAMLATACHTSCCCYKAKVHAQHM